MDRDTDHLPCLRLREHPGRGGGKIVGARESVCCEPMPLRNVRSYAQEVSPTWLPTHGQTKTRTIAMANWTGESLPLDKEPQAAKVPSERNSLP